MLNRTPTFVVPSKWQLQDRRFYRTEVWSPARREHRYIGSRRKWHIALEQIYQCNGQIFFADGTLYPMPEIAEIFPDCDMRWMTDFLAAVPGGDAPKTYSPLIDRLELICLLCRIRAHYAP